VAAAHFAHGGLGLPLDGAQEAQPGGKRDGKKVLSENVKGKIEKLLIFL